ncbi:uncharacterized protein DDB_G0287625-like [Mytilus californianus]|uniref:uncharacterized protein DDB_G0287625-like n=1 Tax=Mytilus californianus TaxID=6549 RepID=UPI002247B242|nr:uncharacterized protein DDB_G0287625-like [Mytilus californianus]
MPSEGIVYRSGKKNLQRKSSKISLAQQIAQNRAHGFSSANYSARSGKSNKTGSDLDSVDISHLTKLDEAKRTPTPLPTVNPRNIENKETKRKPLNAPNSKQRPGEQQQSLARNNTQNMSRHNNDNSRQILPPASNHSNGGGSKSRQTGTTNHGVSLPPIQNNNKVTNRNSESIDLSRQTHSQNQQREYLKQDPYHKNRGYTNNDDNNYYDRNNNSRYSNKEMDNKKYARTTDKSQEHSPRRSRSSSPKRGNKGTMDNKSHKTNQYDIDRHESSKRQKQRSRSTNREKRRHNKSGEVEYRNRSTSRYRESRQRSKPREDKKTRTSSQKRENKHRSQSSDRKYTPHSQSHDRGSRRRSKSRDRGIIRRSKSRSNDRRKRSRSRDHHKTIRHKSRSTSRHSKRGKSRSKSRHSEYHRYRSKSRERNERRKRKDEYYRSASGSPPREHKDEHHHSKTKTISVYSDHRKKSLSDSTLNKRSKPRGFSHGKSSRPSSGEYFTEENRKSKHSSRHLKSKTHVYDSDSCTSESDIEISSLSRKEIQKRLARSQQNIRLSKSHAKNKKSKLRRGSVSDSERSYKYNIILIDESDDSEEDLPSNQAFYVRSKSQHAVPFKARRHKLKEYYSDIESNDRNNTKAVIYNEPDKVIVAPRNTLDVPRTIQHVHTVGTSQPHQPQKELFYLVPASQHTANSQYNHDSALFDADVGRRVVHMPQPIQNSRNEQQLYFLNSGDSVYGQEPLYDEYRQPAQQKYYNQHTNHYRHKNRTVNAEQKFLYSQNALQADLSINQQNVTVKRKQNQISEDNLNQNHKLSMPKTTVEANRLVQSSRITPDGQSNSSSGHTPSTFDENESRMSSRDDNRVSTAEKRRALKQLNDVSNYNIDLALGKASLHSPPMTDETLIKKIFNAEFQSEMDDYLRS